MNDAATTFQSDEASRSSTARTVCVAVEGFSPGSADTTVISSSAASQAIPAVPPATNCESFAPFISACGFMPAICPPSSRSGSIFAATLGSITTASLAKVARRAALSAGSAFICFSRSDFARSSGVGDDFAGGTLAGAFGLSACAVQPAASTQARKTAATRTGAD